MKNKVISYYEIDKQCKILTYVVGILAIIALFIQMIYAATRLESIIKEEAAAQNTETISQHIEDEET